MRMEAPQPLMYAVKAADPHQLIRCGEGQEWLDVAVRTGMMSW